MLDIVFNVTIIKILMSIQPLESLGRFTLFVWSSLQWLFRKPFRWRLIIDEIHFIGNESLSIVALTSLFTGAVFAYQSWLAFAMVGTESLVGVSVSLALVRELAPVMTALVVTGRAGAAIAAQLGNMRVSEQIDALEVMAISPQQYLVAPKLVAGLIALPLLTAIFGMIGNLGGYFVAVYVCDIDGAIYVAKLREFMDPWDFYHGLIKAAFFGFLLAAIGCHQGFKAKNGAQGVGQATNNAVVYAFMVILVLDYFLSVLVPTGIRER
jgi:phospholipid/cholesterol/gamma-HCH transport system permease protein